MNTPRVHTKLKTLTIDQRRCILYSSDDEAKIIHAYDLNARKSAGHIKCSNASPNRLLIDTDI